VEEKAGENNGGSTIRILVERGHLLGFRKGGPHMKILPRERIVHKVWIQKWQESVKREPVFPKKREKTSFSIGETKQGGMTKNDGI